jgi:hypothetical protein
MQWRYKTIAEGIHIDTPGLDSKSRKASQCPVDTKIFRFNNPTVETVYA